MAVGDVYKLIVVGEIAGTPNIIVNSFHYRQEDVVILDTPEEDLAAAWLSDVLTPYLTPLSNQFRTTKLQVVPRPGGAVSYETPALYYGVQSAHMLPPQTAPLVKWLTGVPGRSHKGRSYLPPICEDVSSGGQITGDGLTRLNAFISAAVLIGDGITQSFWQLVVWSEKNSSFTAVTTGILDTTLATIRGRRV